MDTDLYELHWNNHSRVLKGTFDIFRNGNELIDVTLSFSNGMKLGAHKIVLSACSEYFLGLFRDNPCQHPIIIMTEIAYEAMVNILDFMYTGEINIQIENLDSFLKVAETLQIKGLTIQNDPNKNETPLLKNENLTTKASKKRTLISSDSSEKRIENKLIKLNTQETSENFINDNKKSVTKEIVSQKTKNEEILANAEVLNDDENEQKSGIIDLDLLNDDSVEYEATFEEVSATEDDTQKLEISNVSTLTKTLSSYPCPYCKKIFNHYISLKLHLPSHSGDTSCHLCGAVLGRKYDLKVHLRRKHFVNIDGTPAFSENVNGQNLPQTVVHKS